MFALIKNDKVIRYPYAITDARKDNPNVSFSNNTSDDDMSAIGAKRIYFSTPPTCLYDEIVEETLPIFNNSSNRWEQQWIIRKKSTDEVNSYYSQIKENIIYNTQERLDNFAKTRNYDSILSACTYANSTVPKFQQEGQYCIQARDTTWSKLYEIFEEIEAGIKSKSVSYQDIEPELPVLDWPI